MRETLEEANARVEIVDLYSMISLPYISQVYVLFRARLLDADFSPGSESLDVRLFSEAEIPWNALAFRTIQRTLQHYYQDRKAGRFSLHVSTIEAHTPMAPEESAAG
jgi:ADP-ribose pyrophosphatase YjhB (NUDIX family)